MPSFHLMNSAALFSPRRSRSSLSHPLCTVRLVPSRAFDSYAARHQRRISATAALH